MRSSLKKVHLVGPLEIYLTRLGLFPSWIPKLGKAAHRALWLNLHSRGQHLSVCFFFQSLKCFPSWCFLVCKKVKRKKKKTYNTEYLRKEIHVTLTTSTSCQILSINSPLWALSSAVLVSPPLLLQCVAPSEGSIAFNTTSASHLQRFCMNILCLEIFCSPPFLSSFFRQKGSC